VSTLWTCSICSQPHRVRGKVQPPREDPTAECEHRERELLYWVRANEARAAQARRQAYLESLAPKPAAKGKPVVLVKRA
jgi:hypothetical protein